MQESSSQVSLEVGLPLSGHDSSGTAIPPHLDSAAYADENVPDTVNGGIDVEAPVFTTRSGRATRRTWRVEDVLPEQPGAIIDEELIDQPEHPAPSLASALPRARRVVLLVTDRVRTVVNKFGLRRFYKRRPVHKISEDFDLATRYTPTAVVEAARQTPRAIHDIIYPYPNLTSWLFARHHWLRGKDKSVSDRDDLQALIIRDDFHKRDLAKANLKKLDDEMASGVGTLPWDVDREGWLQSSITFGIPTGIKSTQATRRADATERRHIDQHEFADDVPAAQPIRGNPFTVPGFWHRSICAEIRKTLSGDPNARRFVYEPYLLEYVPPGGNAAPQGVHGELYNSPAFVDEDLRLQNSPREPGCDLPRAIAGLMFWSDATHVSQFGQAKVWPAYMYFGNQSKYERARPTSCAAHHIAYFPSLPDTLQDQVRSTSGGKAATAPLLTHCRRELFQGGWGIMLDDEFVQAYHHGMVVDCIDGIRRRIYPRIFTYSADYPEKVLLATIRDKGRCPCPRCLMTFDDIPNLGTAADMQSRQTAKRYDDGLRREAVSAARDLIYNDGYVVNSTKVEELLKPQSLVPTENVFSTRLQGTSFDFHKMLAVDLLHEFELGVWKAVFSHLIRILEAHNPTNVHELNHRYRQVPAFSSIRAFAANVSDMRKIAARDFEDILQCAIPCFEGLFPDEHDGDITNLLYTLAYWHGIAKMRMHTDPSIQVQEDVTSALGVRLRHFSNVTCQAFNTKETDREYAARVRAEARRGPTSQPRPSASEGGRRLRTFNLRTIKTHFLGYYAPSIRYSGTTDSASTQIGEHEHRRVKARYARTNYRQANSQIVNMDVRESRFRSMADELQQIGIDVPGIPPRPAESGASPLAEGLPSDHHHIAVSQKTPIHLRDWRAEHPNDPALAVFVPQLKKHIFDRFRDQIDVTYEPQPDQIIFHGERIYRHATAHINYTTYDLQRDRDTIHPGNSRCGILVHSRHASALTRWSYAWVLGVYHADIYLPGSANRTHRVEFLWVRWMDRDITVPSGPAALRLERVHFSATGTSGDMFGFVDPTHVIRGCHFIPAFHYGRTTQWLPDSIARDKDGDWKYHYVNRFVDRDMMVRFLGMGIGHGDLKATIPESFPVPTEITMDSMIQSTILEDEGDLNPEESDEDISDDESSTGGPDDDLIDDSL
ncbi:hypothetical protein FA95DRAFT_1232934 [Auriscalpium vulgare]|uniref:Uncharacterized protein n=1 Tax=Auriscalpium vulgare TaxID=40419 RepID=A0ACB8R2K0_9AGAM|nr:hypothetical protein FA95DRAFT_1232934 [Auriscalpium vulgare]